MKRKLIFAFSFTLFTLAASSQIRVGLMAGENRSNQVINVNAGGQLFAGSRVQTYHAGFTGDLNLFGRFYLQPQLLWSQKGATYQHSTELASARVRLNYLEVPVNLLYKFDLPFGKAFGGAGMSAAYAFSGRKTRNGEKSSPFSGQESVKRVDFGLSFTAGLEFNNGLFLSMESHKGLMDISRTPGIRIRNQSASLSVGYLIDWHKLGRHH